MDDILTLCSQASLVYKNLLHSAENVSKNATIADWKYIAGLLQVCNILIGSWTQFILTLYAKKVLLEL